MKTFVINSFFPLFLMFTTLSCASQKNLVQKLSESRNDSPHLSYLDSSGKGYERGLIGGMQMKVIFKRIEFDKKTSLLIVEGQTTTYISQTDTVGLCCVGFFIAQPNNGYLTKIKKLGETNSNQTGNPSKPDGYFSFEIKINAQDRLYFASSGGTGLEEYDIGNACLGKILRL